MKHLIDPMDLSMEEINHLLELADDIILHKEKYQEVCKHNASSKGRSALRGRSEGKYTNH